MEEVQAQAEGQEQVTEPETRTESTIDVEAVKTEAVNMAAEKFKKEISGLNRKNTELAEALDEIKKSSMAEAERYQYELEQRENAIAAKEQALLKSSNRDKALKFATENNIPIDLLDTLSYDNYEAVEVNLNKLKTVVDSERTKIIEEFKTSSGHAPVAGGNAVGGVVGLSSLKGKSASEINGLIKEGRVDFKR